MKRKKEENFQGTLQDTVISYSQDSIYRRSYQEAIQRPITIDFSDPNIFQPSIMASFTGELEEKIQKRYSTLINGNSEDTEPDKLGNRTSCDSKLLKQISSGSGTEKVGSKGNF